MVWRRAPDQQIVNDVMIVTTLRSSNDAAATAVRDAALPPYAPGHPRHSTLTGYQLP